MSRLKELALASLRPGAQWSLDGERLIWLDDQQDEPSENEIAQEMARLAVLREPELQERQHRRAEVARGVTPEDKLEACVAFLIDGDRTALDRIAAVRQEVRGNGRGRRS